MAPIKRISEMYRLPTGGWTIGDFVPMQPAFQWDRLRGKSGTLYVLTAADLCKIGMTTNFLQRYASLNTASPIHLEIAATRDVPLAGLAYAEAWLHQKFAEHRVKNEWFKVGADIVGASLDEAEARAKGYARCCRDWFNAKHGLQKPRRQKRPSTGLSLEEFESILAEPGVLDALESIAA